MEAKVQNILIKLKCIEENLLEYINDDQDDENFEKFTNAMIKEKIIENEDNFKLILHLISNISAYHLRKNNFHNKIYKILSTYSSSIKSISNYEKYMIFQNDPVILLYLFENKLLIPDQSIETDMKDKDYFVQKRAFHIKYKEYFFKEFHFNDPEFKKEYIEYFSNEEYTQKKRTGENSNYISKLIREDLLDEFIEYINKNNINLDSYVNEDNFETNFFIFSKLCQLKMIEYAAFCGSLNIFKYLYINKVPISDFIWIYVIHGNNYDIFHLVEEKIKINPENVFWALQFHNYEMADYFINNYDIDEYINSIQHKLISNYNFKYLNTKYILNSKNSFDDLCNYNYIYLAKLLLLNNQSLIKDNYPLYYAVRNGNIEFIKFLLKNTSIDDYLNSILNKIILNQVLIQF